MTPISLHWHDPSPVHVIVPEICPELQRPLPEMSAAHSHVSEIEHFGILPFDFLSLLPPFFESPSEPPLPPPFLPGLALSVVTIGASFRIFGRGPLLPSAVVLRPTLEAGKRRRGWIQREERERDRRERKRARCKDRFSRATNGDARSSCTVPRVCVFRHSTYIATRTFVVRRPHGRHDVAGMASAACVPREAGRRLGEELRETAPHDLVGVVRRLLLRRRRRRRRRVAASDRDLHHHKEDRQHEFQQQQ